MPYVKLIAENLWLWVIKSKFNGYSIADVVTQEVKCYKKKGKAQVLDDKHGSKSSDEEDMLLFTDEPNHEWH